MRSCNSFLGAATPREIAQLLPQRETSRSATFEAVFSWRHIGCHVSHGLEDVIPGWRKFTERPSGSEKRNSIFPSFWWSGGKRTIIFLDAKKNTPVCELKNIITGIAKAGPERQMLFKDKQCLDDNKHLTEYGGDNSTAKAQVPAGVWLPLRDPHSGM